MGQCPCLPSVHLFLAWMVGSVCSWQNPGTDLCPPLLTRLQDPGQGSGALSGIYRKIWPGRENKYSPWFHLQCSQASLWNREGSLWSWPCCWRDGYLSTLWLTCTELSEPRGRGEVLQRAVYAPFPWQNWDHFTVSHWGVSHCYGQDVPDLRISSMCNLYASHLLWSCWQLLTEVYWGNMKNLCCSV